MAPARSRSIDLFSLVLGALTLFLLLSLLSYDSADPVDEPIFPLNRIYQPIPVSFPPHETLRNWCGPVGALVADMLLQSIGWGAYYLVFALAILTGRCLTQRPVTAPFIRVFGWLASLLGLTALISMSEFHSWNGPAIGPGGYVGALGQTILQYHLATIGGLLIAGCALIGGLLLCTDYILFQIAVLATQIAVERSLAGRTIKPKRVPATGEMSVRIRGKKVASVLAAQGPPTEWKIVDEEEESEEDEDEESAEYEDEEEGGYEDEEEEYEEEEEEEAAVEVTARSTKAANNAKSRGNETAAGGEKARGIRGLLERAAPGLRASGKPDPKAEVQAEREEVIAQLEEASRHEEVREYDLPSIELLQESEDFSTDEQEKEVRRKAKVLEKTFQDFGFRVKVVEIETGPVIAQYEIELEAGLRLSKITSLADDLAIALRVPSVRIVAPIPGKNTVGIEVPNEQRQVVRLREVMEETNGRVKKMRIPLFLGKDVSGNPLTVDLSSLPHLLIAGRTGTGKSVCLNAIICSILMTRRPDEVRMLMIDPKMVELSGYRTLPHLMHPVVTDMRKAEAILAWAVEKMEERYSLLARVGVRHISGYNQLGEEELMDRLQPENDEQRASIPINLPYIVIVADEMADLMMTSGKEVEQHIIRLAQKSRAVGIHLILATQKPTVDVITGLIKSNLPARIAFQVASRTDSRVVLDEMGADKLLGNGDMLFLWPGTSTLLRGQGTYLSDDEINKIVEVVSTGEQDFVHELVSLKVDEPAGAAAGPLKKRDDLYDSAVDIVIREGRGSVSLLQRCLGIGYGRAARLIDFMAEDGIVGTYNGSQAREVVITLDDWHRMQGLAGSAESSESTGPPASAAKERAPRNKPATKTISLAASQEAEDDDEAEEATIPLRATSGTQNKKSSKAAPTRKRSMSQEESEDDEDELTDELEEEVDEEEEETDELDEDYEEEEDEEEYEDEESEEDELEDEEEEEEEDEEEEAEEYAEEDDEAYDYESEDEGEEAIEVDEDADDNEPPPRFDGPEFRSPHRVKKGSKTGKKSVN